MVVDIKLADGYWTSFAAASMPEELDDAINTVHAQYYLAQTKLTALELLGVLPVSFPMTHNLPEFPGIAKYPIDEWEAIGAPYLSVKSWAKLAMHVAKHDMTNLKGCLLYTSPSPRDS